MDSHSRGKGEKNRVKKEKAVAWRWKGKGRSGGGGGLGAAEPRVMPFMLPFCDTILVSNVFMLTDSQMLWTVSHSFNIMLIQFEKRF